MAVLGGSLTNVIRGWVVALRRRRRLAWARNALGRSELFDPRWYRLTHELDSATDPLSHYLSGPIDRRPSPWFDATWYLGRYPDISRSGLHPLEHYVLF